MVGVTIDEQLNVQVKVYGNEPADSDPDTLTAKNAPLTEFTVIIGIYEASAYATGNVMVPVQLLSVDAAVVHPDTLKYLFSPMVQVTVVAPPLASRHNGSPDTPDTVPAVISLESVPWIPEPVLAPLIMGVVMVGLVDKTKLPVPV